MFLHCRRTGETHTVPAQMPALWVVNEDEDDDDWDEDDTDSLDEWCEACQCMVDFSDHPIPNYCNTHDHEYHDLCAFCAKPEES